MRKYSVRKMGMRNGKPHYSADCNVCSPPKVLIHAYATKERAIATAQLHILKEH